MMAKYIFLDTWALSNYTKAEHVLRLESFIKSHGYTILFNGVSITELYNPGWEEGEPEERGARVARFLGQQNCVVVRPEEVWKAEIANFPRGLSFLPIQFDLVTLPASQRESAILSVLRGDKTLRDNAIDIVRWKTEYEGFKSQWLASVEQIIEEGVRQQTLIKSPGGRYRAVSREKREEFLLSLDWRFADSIPPDFVHAASVMRSIRCSTLYFWYQYIDYPPGATPKKSLSDIGDIFQLSLAPYCEVVTADTKIAPILKRTLKELSCSCQVYTHHELETQLGIER